MSIKIRRCDYSVPFRGHFFTIGLLFVLPFLCTNNIRAGERGASRFVERAEQLPPGVLRMHQALLRAARSGIIDRMREVLEVNELMPLINGKFIHDPVKHWKALSKDGSGREYLAQLSQILELPPVKVMIKKEKLYIWPYFAQLPLNRLSPVELVRLYRLAPASKIAGMLKSNRYSHAQITLGADGTWHSFDTPFDQISNEIPPKP